MHVESYVPELREAFLRYCRSQARFLDETHLNEKSLNGFVGDGTEPTFLLLNDELEILGVASVMWHGPLRDHGIARFRIFHCWRGEFWHYQMLWAALVEWSPKELGQWMHFIPQENSGLRRHMTTLGFGLERYSFILERNEDAVEPPQWAPGYSFQQVQEPRDRQAERWVRKQVFPMLQTMNPEWSEVSLDSTAAETYLLRHGEHPVGVVVIGRVWHKGNDRNHIEVLAVVPEYQGQGLGRQLLRAALEVGAQRGAGQSVIAVSAQNRNAISLYIQEGFAIDKVLECWTYRP